jgi:hypothetical protein
MAIEESNEQFFDNLLCPTPNRFSAQILGCGSDRGNVNNERRSHISNRQSRQTKNRPHSLETTSERWVNRCNVPLLLVESRTWPETPLGGSQSIHAMDLDKQGSCRRQSALLKGRT